MSEANEVDPMIYLEDGQEFCSHVLLTGEPCDREWCHVPQEIEKQ